MTLEFPDLVNSKWIILEPDNWHLKKGAPNSVKKEFEKFMAELKKAVNTDGSTL